MSKFRKKPVVIEAVQFDCSAAGVPYWREMQPPWLVAALNKSPGQPGSVWVDRNGDRVTVSTLEGHMQGNEGDYLIRGVKGELYFCDAEIFAATYEPVEGVA